MSTGIFKRDNDKDRFVELQKFHRAVLSSQVSHQMVTEYSEVLERTRERIEVKKYASGNIALARVTKHYGHSYGWHFSFVC